MPAAVENGKAAIPQPGLGRSGTVPVHRCDLVEGATLGQEGLHGHGGSSEELFSSRAEGWPLPGDPVPDEAVTSPSGFSVTDQIDT